MTKSARVTTLNVAVRHWLAPRLRRHRFFPGKNRTLTRRHDDGSIDLIRVEPHNERIRVRLGVFHPDFCQGPDHFPYFYRCLPELTETWGAKRVFSFSESLEETEQGLAGVLQMIEAEGLAWFDNHRDRTVWEQARASYEQSQLPETLPRQILGFVGVVVLACVGLVAFGLMVVAAVILATYRSLRRLWYGPSV